MFDFLDAPEEDVSPIVLGIGSVGCKIVDDIFKSGDLEETDVKKTYVHSSLEIINRHAKNQDESILIKEHVHFIDEEIEKAIKGYNVVFLVSGLGGRNWQSSVSIYCQDCQKAWHIMRRIIFIPI